MLSVIIPTLNEADHLPGTVGMLRQAAGGEPFELVVSDCDSRDGTADAARRLGAIVVTGGTCRSDALRRGAAAATGDVLLFLHADTKVPAGFAGRIRRALRRPDVVGGAFEFRFRRDRSASWLDRQLLTLVVFLNRIRYRHGRGFFGDQAIFVRRAAYDRVGGFPPVRLLEDLRFSQAMSRVGRTAILNPPVRTSARRFVKRGVLRQLAQDWLILACDSFGVTPAELWEHYNAHNRGDTARARVIPFPARAMWGAAFARRPQGAPPARTSS